MCASGKLETGHPEVAGGSPRVAASGQGVGREGEREGVEVGWTKTWVEGHTGGNSKFPGGSARTADSSTTVAGADQGSPAAGRVPGAVHGEKGRGFTHRGNQEGHRGREKIERRDSCQNQFLGFSFSVSLCLCGESCAFLFSSTSPSPCGQLRRRDVLRPDSGAVSTATQVGRVPRSVFAHSITHGCRGGLPRSSQRIAEVGRSHCLPACTASNPLRVVARHPAGWARRRLRRGLPNSPPGTATCCVVRQEACRCRDEQARPPVRPLCGMPFRLPRWSGLVSALVHTNFTAGIVPRGP